VSTYQVRLPVFEGPLDLLLQLIERRRLDVTTVSLALVTDQYLEHLRSGAGVDLEQLSGFVVVAAKLLLIKSQALLPQPERPRADGADSEPEDPTDLTERLREYEAIRRAAWHLRGREDADLRSYPHVPPASLLALLRDGGGQAETEVEPLRSNGHQNGGATLAPRGLLAAFRRVASRRQDEPVAVEREVWTVAEALGWVLRMVRAGSGSSFRRLVAGLSRSRLVAAFLALLELHRQGQVGAHQPEPYADIELTPAEREGLEAQPLS